VVDLKTGKVISSAEVKLRIGAATDFSPKEADRLWRLLGSDDETEAEQAIERLVGGRDRALAALRERMRPLDRPNPQRIKELVRLLDDSDADVRERATCDLIQAGSAIENEVRALMGREMAAETEARLRIVLNDISTKDAPDQPPAARSRREQRLVRMLQEIGTPEAVERLITMSAGPEDASATRLARIALQRV
jgi:hypothetical protein